MILAAHIPVFLHNHLGVFGLVLLYAAILLFSFAVTSMGIRVKLIKRLLAPLVCAGLFYAFVSLSSLLGVSWGASIFSILVYIFLLYILLPLLISRLWFRFGWIRSIAAVAIVFILHWLLEAFIIF